jgi:hypothetical protein
MVESALLEQGTPVMVSAHIDRTPRPELASRSVPSPKLGRTSRVFMVFSALGLMGVLGIARWLEPDARGHGTHTQLGLYPCTFLTLTGYKCPSCGMTTAFAWTVRGRLGQAWRSNPAGSLIAPVCVLMVPWLLVGAARGRPLGAKTLEGPLIAVVVAAVALSLAAWTLRLLFWRVLG